MSETQNIETTAALAQGGANAISPSLAPLENPSQPPSSYRPAMLSPTSSPDAGAVSAPCHPLPQTLPPEPSLALPPHPIEAPRPSTTPLFHPSTTPLPLSALAAILGCTRSTVRHFADKFGFRYTVRNIGPRHKRAACLTPDQANAIAAEVQREAATLSPSPSLPVSPSPTTGLFYLLQLEPQHDPGRFKLGFSTDLPSRLDDLLTVVPLAKLIATWPAHRSWERIAIVSAAQNAEQISQEVFRIERLEDAVAAANRFFAVMPRLVPENLPLELLTTVQSPPHPKDRWFPTTADPTLPEAATLRPHGGSPPKDDPPPSSDSAWAQLAQPAPAPPALPVDSPSTSASAPAPILPIIPITPTGPNDSPPAHAFEFHRPVTPSPIAAAAQAPP